MEETELSKGLLHLVDGAGAVKELELGVRVGKDVAGDEGEECYGFAGAGWHLEETVTLGVEGSLEFNHVCVLLWVDVVVWEVHCHLIYLELHFR